MAVIAEVDLRAKQNPVWDCIAGYPGQRGNDFIWLQMKTAEGLRAGFADLIILHPAHGYHAAFVELKVTAKVSPEQKIWLENRRRDAYFADVMRAQSAQPVIEFLGWYLGDESVGITTRFFDYFEHYGQRTKNQLPSPRKKRRA